MSQLLQVLHEDEELLVLHKPAGLVCHPTKGDAYSSLVSRVRLYTRSDSEPQMVHRLDRETSGVMVFGKTAEASLTLRRLWETGLVTKEYLAIVHGHVAKEEGLMDGPLGRDESSAIAIKDCVRPDGTTARTRWWCVRRFSNDGEPFSLVRVRLDTGRKHQIRIHFAHAGHPLVGEKMYGSDEELYLAFVQRRLTDTQKKLLRLPNQALHAWRLWLPWNGEEREFGSAPEWEFEAFLKGQPVEWHADPFDPQREGLS
jgi:23S rRNA pseudouridine1911/1915/1917 synthase